MLEGAIFLGLAWLLALAVMHFVTSSNASDLEPYDNHDLEMIIDENYWRDNDGRA